MLLVLLMINLMTFNTLFRTTPINTIIQKSGKVTPKLYRMLEFTVNRRNLYCYMLVVRHAQPVVSCIIVTLLFNLHKTHYKYMVISSFH